MIHELFFLLNLKLRNLMIKVSKIWLIWAHSIQEALQTAEIKQKELLFTNKGNKETRIFLFKSLA